MIRTDIAAFVLLSTLAAGLNGCGAASDSAEPAGASDEAELRARSFTGTLVHMAAVGGETTGTWLQTDSGDRVELDLATHGLSPDFVEGNYVTVAGKFKTVQGVEIASRKVLVVTSLKNLGVHTPGASVLTSDATVMIVENKGGGFIAPPPAGSQCAVGAAKFTVDLANNEIAWTQCLPKEPNAPFVPRTGTTRLSTSELRSLKTALAGVKVAKKTDLCGADKPLLTVTVTTPGATVEYADSFYSCQDPTRVHVDGVDAALAKLRDLAG